MSVDKVAVIGGGLMGSGIAQVGATAGQDICLIDVSESILQGAVAKIKSSLDRLYEKGAVKERSGAILKRIRTSTDVAEGVSGADFVIEAIFEDIDLKRQIAGSVDSHAPKHAILATNTSGLSIAVIAEATGRPERVIGTHWSNPPQIMRFVELIKSNYTDDRTLQCTLELCKTYQKEAVVARRDIWFFMAVRARCGLSLEACLMYLNGEAGISEIDSTCRYKLGMPLGVFETMDFSGFADIVTRGLKSTDKILKIYPGFEPWPTFLAAFRHVGKELFQPMADRQLFGVKTGKGFYSYPAGKYVKPFITKESRLDPIQLMAPALNVAAWCVTNGVGSISDIDKSMKLAFGWPKGMFDYVDDLGIGNIVDVLKAKQAKAPQPLKSFYEVDPLLDDWHRS
ncbi:MAG: 3-hydroxyacyl-CoA dehydrogenase NAD-binding domain-containing protein [Dehalococcoidia bacterium]|nr:3-hydroxyacyl-CoA dehydrogenase NAD-binding domain-containing protein [Dehalococcoidia bacterium]